MRTYKKIIIHCSATRPDQDISAADIDAWHIKKGYEGIGYHFFIRLNGVVETGRPIEKVGAHCYGANKTSIGICYAGGCIRKGDKLINIDTRTKEQRVAMHNLVVALLHIYPSIKQIQGHNEYTNKDCPCFDVHSEFDPYFEHPKTWEALHGKKTRDYDLMNDLM